ncbi:MAG TPA: DUF5686 and carboxypeptidase regulatory-like domain-containing protein [Ferruginibacter sp.]|nr:DUF5686 and carboxypeptidase regulatory-like domain-containing protein [Ferruginibacter sp.]HRE62854.1 DUF5686 and carboxypeptidase regulatory-like domain-containing protein [Ferruginibacter sp.]
MRLFLLLLSFTLSGVANCQKLYGTVYTQNGDLLPYSSITVKGTSIGASANDKAKFSFTLSTGNYTIVCQHIGYSTVEKKVNINGDTELSFVLTEQKLQMEEVIVTTGGEDPAYEIIRQAIKKRDYYQKQVKGFETEMYGKDMIKLRSMPKKIFGKKIPQDDVSQMGIDSSGKGIIYLSESVSKIATQQPDKFKMNVISSRVSGSGGFGFTFPAFISLYNNNVSVFTERINPRGFVSPIADGAIGFYKFKLLGTFLEDGKLVNSIKVMPRRAYEPLFNGVINITEDDWRIHSFDLLLTKSAQLEILDSLKITQLHVPVIKDVWRVKTQLLYFNFKMLGIDAVGNFLNVYSNYKVNPLFAKNYFDRVIIKYDTAVNKRTQQYWDSIRPVPLEIEEQKDYAVKDSLYIARKDSTLSKITIDSLNKHRGKVKPLSLFWGGIDRRKYYPKKVVYWGIRALLPNLEYNTVEGVVIKTSGYISSYNRKLKSHINLEPHVRYGVNNGHLNAWANLQFKNNAAEIEKPIRQYSLDIAGGKRVSEFYKGYNTPPLLNTIGVLIWAENRMKTYENYFGSITYFRKYDNGLNFTINALYEDRIPINNTTDFTLFRKDTNYFTPNYPFEVMQQQFSKHQAFILTGSISFKPGQKYIEFPNRKMAVGSKHPTFTLSYAKGINGIFGSDVNFDKWKFSITNDMNLKLGGLFKYNIGLGGFINHKKVFIQDYQHFVGNQSLAATDYLNSFQLAKLYGKSNTADLYVYGHIEHHFNGMLTNKIPLFKKLNWNLVAGSNILYINQNTSQLEFFAGIENILKVLRVDVVSGFSNGNPIKGGVRIGAGGILGGNIKTSKTDRTLTLQF